MNDGFEALREASALPAFLYRAFAKREHAEAFALGGTCRFGHVRVYRATEDAARRDDSEGTAHFVTQSGRDNRTDMESPTFVLCCALPDVDLVHLRASFGQHVVRITDPVRFGADLSAAVEQGEYVTTGGLRCATVEYTRGQAYGGAETIPQLMARLTYAQKSQRFADDREFRFVVRMRHSSGTRTRYDEDHLTVSVGSSRDYLQIIS